MFRINKEIYVEFSYYPNIDMIHSGWEIVAHGFIFPIFIYYKKL